MPSRVRIALSMARWSFTSMPRITSAMALLTCSTALYTLLPPYTALSPSRSSTASWTPVDAPLGTAARPKPPSVVVISTSTVGLPRESRIWRACTPSISPILSSFLSFVLFPFSFPFARVYCSAPFALPYWARGESTTRRAASFRPPLPDSGRFS